MPVVRRLVSSLAPLIVMFALAQGGCDGPQSFPYFHATVKAEWPIETDSAALLGYWVDVYVTKKMDDTGDCATISASTKVLIDGVEATFAADGGAGCMQAYVRLGPFLQNQSVDITVERGGEVVAEATFDQLMPGTGAALVGPTGGLVHAGDVVVVHPLPELPASGSIARFYPLDEPPWRKVGLFGEAERLSDGVHVSVPSFTGRAWLGLVTTDYALAEVSCSGFATCHGEAASLLGPFLITEGP
jgi:hypothetical protein